MKIQRSFIFNGLIFAVIVLIIAISSHSAYNADKNHSIEPFLKVWVDESKSYDVQSVIDNRSQLNFKNYTDSDVSSTIRDVNYWLSIPINDLRHEHDFNILELSKPHLSSVVFYQLSSDKTIVKSIETGRNSAFSSRDIPYRQFLFEIDENHLDGEILMFIHTESYLQAPIKLWAYSEFIKVSNEQSLGLGIFYGALLVMVFYNGFLAVSLKDIRYVFYVLFVFSFLLLQSVWDGYSLQYIWPGLYDLDKIANPFLIGLCSIWVMLFNWFFFEIQKRKKQTRLFYQLFICSNIIILGLVFVINMKPAIYLVALSAVIAVMSSIISFIKSIPKNKSHYIYITAWSVLFYMALISSLGGFNIIPYSILAVHGMKIGILILVLLFSLALSYKIKELDFMRIAETEKGVLLKKLHQVNQKISTIRELKILYPSIYEGYQSFMAFEQMILVIETSPNQFNLNDFDRTAEIHLKNALYEEYHNYEASSISQPSQEMLTVFSKHKSGGYLIPLESRNFRKGFVLFILKQDNQINDQVSHLLIDYTYQISLTIENISLMEELKQAAERDSLTKLYNRKVFFEKGRALLRNTFDDIAMVMIDLDHFKHINDNHGHLVGDKALTAISNEMMNHFPNDSLIARYGGEEFIVLLKAESKEQIYKMIDDFRIHLQNYKIQVDASKVIHVTISGGISFLKSGETMDQLVERSDHNLYEAKKKGRNCIIADEKIS